MKKVREAGLSGTFYSTVIAVLIGIIIGAISAGWVSPQNSEILRQDLLENFETVKTALPDYNAFVGAFAKNAFFVVIISLLGMSTFGRLPILLSLCVRGYITGFTVSFVVRSFWVKGFLYATCAALPQSLLLFPALIACAVAAIEFSRLQRKKEEKPAGYFILCALCLAAAAISGAIEVFICPTLLSL